jgi:uncharacterized membrane protein YozB (DUF420 family)
MDREYNKMFNITTKIIYNQLLYCSHILLAGINLILSVYEYLKNCKSNEIELKTEKGI